MIHNKVIFYRYLSADLSVLPISCKPFAYVICSPEEDKAEARQYKAIVYEIEDKTDGKVWYM